jgi:hypothetical protein
MLLLLLLLTDARVSASSRMASASMAVDSTKSTITATPNDM